MGKGDDKDGRLPLGQRGLSRRAFLTGAGVVGVARGSGKLPCTRDGERWTAKHGGRCFYRHDKAAEEGLSFRVP